MIITNSRYALVGYFITSYPTRANGIISNYWMRLSRIWRILQVEESVIYRGRRPRWITPSEICEILHILRKLNSIIVYYSFKIFSSLELVNSTRGHFSLCWMTQPCAQVFSVNGSIIFDVKWFNNLPQAALLTSFWHQCFNNLQRDCTFDVIGSIWQNSWSTAAVYGEVCVWF